MTNTANATPRPTPSATPGAGSPGGLIETTERLVDVLDRETRLLRAMKLSEAASVQLEKATLAEAYERCIRDLQAEDGAAARALTPAQRSALKQAGERLASASVDNERALRSARSVNERVLAAIVDAAREQRTATHAYGTKGFAAPSGKTALSLSVDRQL